MMNYIVACRRISDLKDNIINNLGLTDTPGELPILLT